MKRIGFLLLTAVLLALCAGGAAQELVSVQALYRQAESMDGRWRTSVMTADGEVAVDAPIIVPDVAAMPVLTVQRAKISEALFETIRLGEKSGAKSALQYQIEREGILHEFYLGREESGKTGYAATDFPWVQHGAYRFSVGTGLVERGSPVKCYYPWEADLDAPLARGTPLTIREIMALWEDDMEMCFPGEGMEIQLKRIIVYGSAEAETDEDGKAYRRTGSYELFAEQLIEGIPLFGAIASQNGENSFHHFGAQKNSSKKLEKTLDAYRAGAWRACDIHLRAFAQTAQDHRTVNSMCAVRSVEHADVPLASLDRVLDGIRREIEAGRIRKVYSVRLGYLLYSNPDMTDHAWAVPRWVVDCDYVTEENREIVRRAQEDREADNETTWDAFQFYQMPVDAQSGAPILYSGLGTQEIFRVPEIVTW